MSSEKRRAQRQQIRWKGLILDATGSTVAPCTMINVSASGAKLIITPGTDVPDCFVLVLSQNGGGVRRLCEVMWRAAKSIGVRFVVLPGVEKDGPLSFSDPLARIVH